MLVTLNGNIATEVKSNYIIKNGQYVPDQRTGKPLVVTEFSMAVPRQSRGNREKTTLDGKNFTSDLYRIKAIGQKAEYLSQYASKGRSICIQGYLLQDEYLANNQTVQIDKNNPLYGFLAQGVGAPNSPVQADSYGNLYITGNTKSKSFTVEVVEVEFNSANPNGGSHTFDPTAFSPNQAMAQGFPTANQGAMPTPGAPLMSMSQPFGANANPGVATNMPLMNVMPQMNTMPQANGIPAMNVMPQMANAMPNYNNNVVQSNAIPANFAVQQPQQNPQQQTQFPGWGNTSQVPQDFTNIQQPPMQTAPAQPVIQEQQQVVTQTQQGVAQPKQEQLATEAGKTETLAFAPNDKAGSVDNIGF